MYEGVANVFMLLLGLRMGCKMSISVYHHATHKRGLYSILVTERLH